MIRYLRASILIGALSAGFTLLLFASGLLATPDQALYKVYSLKQKTLLPLPLVALFLSFFFSFVIAWTTLDITTMLPRGLVATGALLVCLGASWVVSLYNTFISPFLPCTAILLSLIMGGIFTTTKVGQRKRILERLFGRRLAQSQLNQLGDSDQSVLFPGSMIEGTVVVVSVHNHTELMEMMSPEAYAAMTNFYLRAASDFLVESGGYLEQCDGESMRIIFGAPLPDEKHAIKACRIALDLVKRLDTLNIECNSKWQRHIDFRIGIHSGTMVAATFGGTRIGSFSVAGNTSDFVRKLCAVCPAYGCRILTASDTLELAFDSCEVRPIELIRLREGGKRLELYEILAPKHALSEERTRSRDHFWKGVIYFREQKFDKANEEFSLARIKGIPDAVLDHYLERIECARRRQKDEITFTALIF
jgi:adenylate cyclase